MLDIANCKPEETIMIWDKLNDDVLPPRQIWMNSILFENYEQLKKDISSFWIILQ
jgi:FMN phosphatase YigB (HAD superfamily)